MTLTPYPRPDREGDDMKDSQSHRCGEASAGAEVFAGQDAEPSGAAISAIRRFFFGAVPVACSASLRSEPHRWAINRDVVKILGWVNKIIRDDGIELWVGNGSYGMEVTGYGQKWGDVTMLSTFRLSPGHWLLRRAANQWLRDRAPIEFTPHGKLLAALLDATPAHAELSPGNSSDLRGEEG